MRIFLAAFFVAIIAIWASQAWAQEECLTEEKIISNAQTVADQNGFEMVWKRIIEDGEDYVVVIARHDAFVAVMMADCAVGAFHLAPAVAAMRYFNTPLDELLRPPE